MSRIVVHRRVTSYLRRLPPARKAKVKKLLKNLENNPAEIPGAIPMRGEWTGYRRVYMGDLRVIFWLDRRQDVVYVDHLGPRGDVYK